MIAFIYSSLVTVPKLATNFCVVLHVNMISGGIVLLLGLMTHYCTSCICLTLYYTSAVKCVGEAHMTALLESLTALLEYLDLLQFSFQNFNVIY